MARTTKEERQAICHAANIARRGSHSSDAELATRAKAREATKSQASSYEQEVQVVLEQHGYHVRPQMAVGPYNVDLAIPPVAVEVLGGEWHNTDERSQLLKKRTLYLCNRNWFVVMIPVNPGRDFVVDATIADQLVSYLEAVGTDPSLRGQYRMLWGHHHPPTGGRPDVDGVSIVSPFRGYRDPATGRYQRVT